MWHRNQTYTVASAPTDSVLMRRFEEILHLFCETSQQLSELLISGSWIGDWDSVRAATEKFKGTGSRKNGFLLQENCVAGRRNGNKFAAHCFDVKQIPHPVDIGLFSRYCPFTFNIEHFSWHYPIIFKPFRSIFLLFFFTNIRSIKFYNMNIKFIFSKFLILICYLIPYKINIVFIVNLFYFT